MELLYPALLDHIASFLGSADLKALRQVNRNLAESAAPPLFRELFLTGCEQGPLYSGVEWTGAGKLVNVVDASRRPRSRIAEYGQLQTAVDELLTIAPYVRTLTFRPAYYFKVLWKSVQRQRDAMAAKNEKPMPDIDEATWTQMMADQDANQKHVPQALTQLFSEMKRLDTIIIMVPELSRQKLEGFDVYSYLVNNTAYESSKVSLFLKDISQSLLQAKRSIKELEVRGTKYNTFQATPAFRHTMTGLERLVIELHGDEFLLESRPSVPLQKLLKLASATLRSLTIRWKGLPSRGVKELTKLLYEDDEKTPMTLPNLEHFELHTLIASGRQLIDFLAAQPKLATLSTFNVHFGVPGGPGWLGLASALPPPTTLWMCNDRLGSEPHSGFQPPIAYNWVAGWKPSESETELLAVGWKMEPGHGPRYETILRRESS